MSLGLARLTTLTNHMNIVQFWIPDKFVDSTAYSAVHRECQNAALLQMLRAAVDKTTLTSSAGADESIGPPLVHPNPMDFFTASDNLFAFSDEIRRRRREQKQKQTQPPPSEQEEVPVVTMPRFVKCYGWLPCNVHDLMEKMPRHIRLRGFRVDRKLYRSFDPERTDFIGIVYEYIRSNDADGGNVVIAGGNNIKATTTGDGTAKAEEMAATGKERPQAAAPSPSEKAATTTTARHYNTRAAARQMSNEAEAREKKHKEAHKAAASTKDKDAQDAAKDAVHREHVSSVADFLWLAGFDFCIQPLARNWKNGVLVDHSDIIGPYSSGWQRGPRDTKWSIDRLLTPSVIY